MKILCIHPALAPYRLDLFNLLAGRVDLEVAFVHRNLVTQKFNQVALTAEAKFKHRYLNGFDIKGRNIRFGIGKLIRETRPDIVLSYEASPITMWLCLLKSLRLGRWSLWTSMDEAPESIASRRGVRRIVRDWVIRNCDGVIVPSEAAVAAYRAVLPPHSRSSRFSVIPIVHDTAAIRKDADAVISAGKGWRDRFVPRDWKKVLLFAGRLAKVKNLHWLVDQVAKLDKDIGLVLVGSGDEECSLKTKVSEMELSQRVLFAGRKAGDELYAIMSAVDALVLPSIFEPYGAVVPEAMQWGTPCVVSDKCGSAVLVEDGVNGKVFKCDDAASFKSAVTNLPARKNQSILLANLKSAVDVLVNDMSDDDNTRNTIFA